MKVKNIPFYGKPRKVTDVHICRNPDCGKEYTRDEVIRKYGVDFCYGYCSLQCYTKALLSGSLEKNET